MNNIKKTLPLFLLGICLILVLDIIGSIASNKLHFNYGYLFPLSFLILLLIPYFITLKVDRKMGIIVAALLGLFDATMGLKISIMLDANIENPHHNISLLVWIITAVVNTILAALLGLLSTWFAVRKVNKTQKS